MGHFCSALVRAVHCEPPGLGSNPTNSRVCRTFLQEVVPCPYIVGVTINLIKQRSHSPILLPILSTVYT